MKCKKYIIHGKEDYEVIVDKRNLIVSCEKPNKNLLFKDFSNIFDKWKDRIVFEYVVEDYYPLVIEEDIIQEFSEKNPSFKTLINKLNLQL